MFKALTKRQTYDKLILWNAVVKAFLWAQVSQLGSYRFNICFKIIKEHFCGLSEKQKSLFSATENRILQPSLMYNNLRKKPTFGDATIGFRAK